MSDHWWPRLRACIKCGLTFIGINARCNHCATQKIGINARCNHCATQKVDDESS